MPECLFLIMRKRILFTILNWGLGHATRSIPVIRALIGKQVEVIIGSSGEALEVLRKEFPDLEVDFASRITASDTLFGTCY